MLWTWDSFLGQLQLSYRLMNRGEKHFSPSVSAQYFKLNLGSQTQTCSLQSVGSVLYWWIKIKILPARSPTILQANILLLIDLHRSFFKFYANPDCNPGLNWVYLLLSPSQCLESKPGLYRLAGPTTGDQEEVKVGKFQFYIFGFVFPVNISSQELLIL